MLTYHQQYSIKNRAKINAIQSKYYYANKEAIYARQKVYIARVKEEKMLLKIKWLRDAKTS